MRFGDWEVVYEKAINKDGSLFFPQKLSLDFLEKMKRSMGSYIFANQYLNQVIPEGEQSFRKEWIRYYSKLPEVKHTFAFIDPAISQSEGADYTALVVVDVDTNGSWYVKVANRYKITPTEIIELIFKVQKEHKCLTIGIEDVAYQKALIYMLDTESRRRGIVLPVKGCKPGNDESKEYRIRALVPRFEWSRIFFNRGLEDLEIELLQFPRGSHDDLIDALAYVESICVVPSIPKPKEVQPHISQGAEYEKWYRNQLRNQRNDD